MNPVIDSTGFGAITITGTTFAHDVIIRLDGTVDKRRKRLSKALYGTSHIVSLDEARYVYEKGAERLIVGTGQRGLVQLSDEAAAYLHRKQCKVLLLPTEQACQAWNRAEGAVIALMHVTC
jgi:hypothetical protein